MPSTLSRLCCFFAENDSVHQHVAAQETDALIKLESGAELEEEPAEEKSTCFQKTLLITEAQYNFVTTLAKTFFVSASTISNLIEREKNYFGMSDVGIGVSVPLAVLFAFAETYSHYSQSCSLNDHDAHHHAQPPATGEKKVEKVSLGKKVLAGIHTASDIVEGGTGIVAMIQTFGLNEGSLLSRFGLYGGAFAYSALGNAQGFVNTINSFRMNQKKKG